MFSVDVDDYSQVYYLHIYESLHLLWLTTKINNARISFFAAHKWKFCQKFYHYPMYWKWKSCWKLPKQNCCHSWSRKQPLHGQNCWMKNVLPVPEQMLSQTNANVGRRWWPIGCLSELIAANVPSKKYNLWKMRIKTYWNQLTCAGVWFGGCLLPWEV